MGNQEDRHDRIKTLKSRCRINGCGSVSIRACTYCGHNLREEALRQQRGLVRDEDTGLWHFVPTQKPDPVQIIGADDPS